MHPLRVAMSSNGVTRIVMVPGRLYPATSYNVNVFAHITMAPQCIRDVKPCAVFTYNATLRTYVQRNHTSVTRDGKHGVCMKHCALQNKIAMPNQYCYTHTGTF